MAVMSLEIGGGGEACLKKARWRGSEDGVIGSWLGRQAQVLQEQKCQPTFPSNYHHLSKRGALLPGWPLFLSALECSLHWVPIRSSTPSWAASRLNCRGHKTWALIFTSPESQCALPQTGHSAVRNGAAVSVDLSPAVCTCWGYRRVLVFRNSKT